MAVARVSEISADLAAGLRGRHPPRPRARQQDPARRHLGLGQGAAGQAPDGQIQEYQVNIQVTFVLDD